MIVQILIGGDSVDDVERVIIYYEGCDCTCMRESTIYVGMSGSDSVLSCIGQGRVYHAVYAV